MIFDILVIFLDINKVLMTPNLFPILDNVKRYVVVNFDSKMTDDKFNKITHF